MRTATNTNKTDEFLLSDLGIKVIFDIFEAEPL